MCKHTAFLTMNMHEALELKSSANSTKSAWQFHCELLLLQSAIWFQLKKSNSAMSSVQEAKRNILCLMQEHVVNCLWVVLHTDLLNKKTTNYLKRVDKQNFVICSDNTHTHTQKKNNTRQHFPKSFFMEIICFISVLNKHEQLIITSSTTEEQSPRFFLPTLLENEWIQFGQFFLSYFTDSENQKAALSKWREKH